MKLSEKLLRPLFAQVNMEFASGYLYRSMSHDMKNLALNGYAKWLDKQYGRRKNTCTETDRLHWRQRWRCWFHRYLRRKNTTAILSMLLKILLHWRSNLSIPWHFSNLPAKKEIWKQKFSDGIYWTGWRRDQRQSNVAGFEKAKDCDGLLYMISTLILLIVNRIVERRHLVNCRSFVFKKG